jgi:transposase-like protein
MLKYILKGCDFMGRPKCGKNKTWSKDEKLRIVRRYFDEGIGQKPLAKEEGIARGMLANWIYRYLDEGEDGLENKKKTGNKFAALNTSNSLSEVDRLRLIVAKQEIEIERLKKGYIVKGAGAKKEFVTTKDASTKSSID